MYHNSVIICGSKNLICCVICVKIARDAQTLCCRKLELDKERQINFLRGKLAQKSLENSKVSCISSGTSSASPVNLKQDNNLMAENALFHKLVKEMDSKNEIVLENCSLLKK